MRNRTKTAALFILTLLFITGPASAVALAFSATARDAGAETAARKNASLILDKDDAEYLTEEERYGVEEAWIEVSADGSVNAVWTPAKKCADYYVTVFFKGRKALEHCLVKNASSFDITDIAAENGEGKYTFTVFSTRGGPKMKKNSEEYVLTDKEKDRAKALSEKREDQRICENGGIIEKLTVKAVERKVKDLAVRALEFPDGKYYKVTDVHFSSDQDIWLPGKLIEAEVTIQPKDGFSFDPQMILKGSSNLKTFEAGGEGDTRTIRASYMANAQLGKPRPLYVTQDGELIWEADPFASGYTVTLSRMGTAETTVQTSKARVDLWELTENISDVRSDLSLLDVTILARGDGTVFRNSEKCQIIDMEKFLGEALIEGYVTEEEGDLYFSYDDGAVAEGWILLRGNWFYFGKNGKMYRNCTLTETDGSSYRFNRYGRMLQSELYLDADGIRYYGADGRMVKDAVTPEGYVVDADGFVVVAKKYIDALENW